MIRIRNGSVLRKTCAIAMLMAAQSIGASEGSGRPVGEAFDLQSDELLYREIHCVDADLGARKVVYHNIDGQLLARKLVDYNSGLTTPSFVQHNLYSSEVIEVALSEGKLTMSVHDSSNRQEKKSSLVEPGNHLPVVIDAGFDEFIRSNWDDLVAGGEITFLFPLAARSSLVELRVRPAACRYQTDSDQCFRLEPSNWVLRLLAAPIELGYDAEHRRLSRFRGLSNIGDENGDGQSVDIRYRYDDPAAIACGVDDETLTHHRADFVGISLSGDTGS